MSSLLVTYSNQSEAWFPLHLGHGSIEKNYLKSRDRYMDLQLLEKQNIGGNTLLGTFLETHH